MDYFVHFIGRLVIGDVDQTYLLEDRKAVLDVPVETCSDVPHEVCEDVPKPVPTTTCKDYKHKL